MIIEVVQIIPFDAKLWMPVWLKEFFLCEKHKANKFNI
jgi:hypothetical protein